MEIDTGAAVSIVSESSWETPQKPALQPYTLVLKGYPDNQLDTTRCCDVQVQPQTTKVDSV